MMEYAYLDYIHVELDIKEEHVQAIAQSGSNDAAVAEAMTDGILPNNSRPKPTPNYTAPLMLCATALCANHGTRQ